MRIVESIAVAATVCLATTFAAAQGTSRNTSQLGATNLGGGLGAANSAGRTQGLQQTGQLSSSAAIQRDTSAFVGGSVGNFLSRSGTQGAGGNRLGASTGMGGLGGALGQFGMGAGGFGSGGMGRGGFGNQAFGAQNQSTGGSNLRIRMRIGFSAPKVAATRVSSRFKDRLTHLPALKSAGSVDAQMEGQTVVLIGTVASAHERNVIARLALLEPGIASVRNELLVDPTVAASTDRKTLRR